jgi:glucose/arabinose dehydrogenase
MNGRDYIQRTWDWSAADAENQPAEMLFEIVADGDYGWPYCMGFWSFTGTRLVVAPEYQARQVDCAAKRQPTMGFASGWAPMSIAIPSAPMANGLGRGMLIAFHGSRSRTPRPEDGHFVVFAPMDSSGTPQQKYRLFMHSQEGPGALRAMGLAVAPDGVVYVGDDDHGIIYRVEPRPPARRPSLRH